VKIPLLNSVLSPVSSIARDILHSTQHILGPNYTQFQWGVSFEADAWKNHHVQIMAGRDIAAASLPGSRCTIVTGRSMEIDPCCI